MRRCLIRTIAISISLLVFAGQGFAQEPPNYDELNRKYQDALNQLKAAQDRKNELATENERLNARINDLNRQLDESHRQAATFAAQTYSLRAHYAAWQAFAQRFPGLADRWNQFLQTDPLAAAPHELPELIDPHATLPTTAP